MLAAVKHLAAAQRASWMVLTEHMLADQDGRHGFVDCVLLQPQSGIAICIEFDQGTHGEQPFQCKQELWDAMEAQRHADERKDKMAKLCGMPMLRIRHDQQSEQLSRLLHMLSFVDAILH